MTVATGPLALKEWHVVSEAIGRGDQVLTIRRGGIRENAINVRGASFWLFPSWKHESAADTKRAWHAELSHSLAARPTDGLIPIRSRATVIDAYELSDAEALAALDDFHLWTPAYIEERLRWRPAKPLSVLVLRAESLLEPVLIGDLPAYSGRTSWVELLSDPLARGEVLLPALTDAAFELFRTAIADSLAGCGVEAVAA